MSSPPSDTDSPPAAVPPLLGRPAVPPPPPPSTAAQPVRLPAASAAAPASGIGTAKGVRWRGEVERLGESAAAEADGDPPPQTLAAAWHDTLREAPSWLISLVIHLILILLLALIATPAGNQLSRVVLTLGKAEQAESPELTEFAIDDLVELDAHAFQETEVEVPMPVTPEIPRLETPVVEQPPLVPLGLESEIMHVPPMVSGRSGAMKQALLAAYGGTEETEDAVQLGLQWLQRQQRQDGSWLLTGPYSDGVMTENRAAATAMAMLAFMGAGHTHRSGDYVREMEKAARWLVSEQDREGYFARRTRDRAGYAQAQCTIAICELYAMTGDSWLRDPAQLAVRFAERAQSREGGWRYQPRNGSDLSVTGWFVMGLESARAAGLKVDPTVMYKVGGYLDSVQTYDGAAYTYQPKDVATTAMTAEGLLCRQYLGWTRDSEPMARAVTTLVNDHNFDIEDRNFYYWYYATQVLHHYGGSPWRMWNASMRSQLPAAQEKDGPEKGSWSPRKSRWGHSGGRLYTTCMAIYCLEVYYRHMPLYAGDQERAALPPMATEAADEFRPRPIDES